MNLNHVRAKAPRVLLVLGWYDYRLHRGIEKYAQEHGWRLSEDLAREKVIPWGWDGDGILAWLGAGDDLADFVLHAGKPTVDFSFRRPQLKFARVLEDTSGAGQLVADHFLSRGFRNFLFYSDAENWVYNERGHAFVKSLKDAGRQAEWLCWHKSAAHRVDRKAWQRKREWLAAELKRVPKPVGIFAASDGLALEVLETCEAAGITVPEEVALVGAGNSLLAVDAMHTPISSVDTNLEVLGYRGAEELDRLMRRKPAPADLGRPWRPFASVTYLNCELGDHIKPAGWDNWRNPTNELTARFAEYKSTGAGANTNARFKWAKQLTNDEADKITVLSVLAGSDDWNPAQP